MKKVVVLSIIFWCLFTGTNLYAQTDEAMLREVDERLTLADQNWEVAYRLTTTCLSQKDAIKDKSSILYQNKQIECGNRQKATERYLSEGNSLRARRKLLLATQAPSNNSPNIKDCIAFEMKRELDTFRSPSCNIHVANSCSVAVECQAEATGVDTRGKRHPFRQAIHLLPGASGVRGISEVIGCESPALTCKVWKK